MCIAVQSHECPVDLEFRCFHYGRWSMNKEIRIQCHKPECCQYVTVRGKKTVIELAKDLTYHDNHYKGLDRWSLMLQHNHWIFGYDYKMSQTQCYASSPARCPEDQEFFYCYVDKERRSLPYHKLVSCTAPEKPVMNFMKNGCCKNFNIELATNNTEEFTNDLNPAKLLHYK